MGQTELKAALQREAEEHIRQAWAEAEQAVTQRRAEIEVRQAELQLQAEQRQAKAILRLREAHLLEVQQQGQQCRLTAEARLDERLRQLAELLLSELAVGNRGTLWSALLSELPEADWATVRVHPDDLERAKSCFADAKIEIDPALVAGLVAISADGLVRVDNSLTCRLARAWTDLLPPLMAQLQPLVETDATTETDSRD